MAHDPTRSWPTGKGPGDTSIPGAAWLELLDGQAFPVVGAGAMVWNGTMWVPVSTQNRLPVDAAVSGTVDVSDRADRQLGKVELSGHSSPPTLVFINSDTVVPAGTSVMWVLSSSERAQINRWPVFAIVLSWKLNSTNLDYTVNCWQYLPNSESTGTPVPESVQWIDTWSGRISDRIFVARIRRFAMGSVILRVTNHSPYDQILSNFSVQCMIEGV